MTFAPVLRTPEPRDAANLWHLLGEIGNLERNSCYTYLLLCSHFASSSLVAERKGDLIGFVLGYRPPSEPSAIFVWQIGVAANERGCGLGNKLLLRLLDQPGCRGVDHVTATVSPDNTASLALFRNFAKTLGVAIVERPCFRAALFAEAHPDENLLRIGPLKGK